MFVPEHMMDLTAAGVAVSNPEVDFAELKIPLEQLNVSCFSFLTSLPASRRD